MCWLEFAERQVTLESIREAVKKVHEEDRATQGELAGFTPHGPEHCEAVEAYICRLIPDASKHALTPRERFCLLAAAWLHDLGMLASVSMTVHGKTLGNHEIRKRHHLTSESYIVENWKRLEIPESHREVLGKLSRFHRRAEDMDDCDEVFIVEGDNVRLRLLACYLRLADALDITGTRTPSEPYSLCLAYDIPEDSKFHWIKSRLVGGLSVDPDGHRVVVQFNRPLWSSLDGRVDRPSFEAKLDGITKIVMNDLREELLSVMETTTRAGFAYYLNVVKSETSVYFDQRMSNDLRELVLNFDIMAAPSSSKLLEMILVDIANILGYSLNKKGGPNRFDNAPDARIVEKLSRFVSSVGSDISASRPCHQGLLALLEDCKALVADLKADDGLEQLALAMNERYQRHHDARSNVRDMSAGFFRDQLPDVMEDKAITVLLYGYSELVTKALCGLRDRLIERKHPVKGRLVMNSPIEEEASGLVSIFVCEGQPKTHTGRLDQVLYHDGSQYARHLREHGFENITIIPDAIAGTLLARCDIDYLFVGANCMGEDYFIHSAGHYSLVALASIEHEGRGRPATTVLVATEDRRRQGAMARDYTPFPGQQASREIDGCTFLERSELGANRSSIWMCRDKMLLEKLHDSGVSLLNPREDCVPSAMVDYLITDACWQRMNPDEHNGPSGGIGAGN